MEIPRLRDKNIKYGRPPGPKKRKPRARKPGRKKGGKNSVTIEAESIALPIIAKEAAAKLTSDELSKTLDPAIREEVGDIVGDTVERIFKRAIKRSDINERQKAKRDQSEAKAKAEAKAKEQAKAARATQAMHNREERVKKTEQASLKKAKRGGYGAKISASMKVYHKRRQAMEGRVNAAFDEVKDFNNPDIPVKIYTKSLRMAIMEKTHNLEDVLNIIYKMAMTSKTTATALRERRFAIEWLTNYGVGKPKSEVDSNQTLNVVIGPPALPTPEENFDEVAPIGITQEVEPLT